MKHVARYCWTALLLAFACVNLVNPAELRAAEEDRVREAFTALQGALKANDAAKIWKLLDADSQADAERRARALRSRYSKATPEDKAELEKTMELSGAELAKLTGEGFLKTKRFRGKYDEIPGSKIDKVTVTEAGAVVDYTEPDNDKEKLQLTLKDGEWKVIIAMPPVK